MANNIVRLTTRAKIDQLKTAYKEEFNEDIQSGLSLKEAAEVFRQKKADKDLIKVLGSFTKERSQIGEGLGAFPTEGTTPAVPPQSLDLIRKLAGSGRLKGATGQKIFQNILGRGGVGGLAPETPSLIKPSELGLSTEVSAELLSDPEVSSINDFGRRLSSGSPEDVVFTSNKVAKAKEAISARTLDVAKKRGISGIEAQISSQGDRQIPVGDLKLIRSADNFTQFPVGTTYGEIKDVPHVIATEAQINEIFDLDSIGFKLDQIDALTKQLITAESPQDAALQGGGLTLEAFARTNPVAATYVKTKKAITNTLARVLGGEKGVMTDQDIKRWVDTLPGFRDTKSIRDLKLIATASMKAMAVKVAEDKVFGRRPDAKWADNKELLLSALETGDANTIRSALESLGFSTSNRLSEADRNELAELRRIRDGR